MYEIDETYPRPKVKKIDNITEKIGIDPKNIGLFENFITKEEVKMVLEECKKNEPKYGINDSHGRSISYNSMGSEKLINFAKYIVPKIKENATKFYNLEQESTRAFQYTFHPDGTYLHPHTDIIGWEPKFDESNEYATQEKYFPYFWSGHLSNILYLNDDYDGGELFFPDFKIDIKPKPGMLAVFPGNTHYLHGVRKVVGSTRYAGTLWTNFKDFVNN